MKSIVLFVLLSSMFAFGAASTPVTVNSITCSAGACTVVTATAHNVPANNPGVCFQGGPAADVLCATAASVTNTTTFVVNSTVMVTCSTSCGTAQPAKNFLISGDPVTNQIGLQQVNVCIWNYVQTPLTIPNKTSACSSAESNATLLTSENGALAGGQWFETTLTFTFASSDTRAQIEQEFQRVQFAMQLAIAAGIQPGRDAGTFCDAVACNQ